MVVLRDGEISRLSPTTKDTVREWTRQRITEPQSIFSLHPDTELGDSVLESHTQVAHGP